MSEPTFSDAQEWIRWGTHWEETLTWWPGLVAVPQRGDISAFVRRVWASFHMPKECYCATKGCNDYMAPPNPHCIKCDNHLPPPDPRLGAQDFHLKQPEKTLAYTKAQQHLAKVANTPWPGELCKLAECVEELR